MSLRHAELPLIALRVFEAVARRRSFTKAAEELGMTQAAASYQIKVLEERVGTPLFIRKPRQIALTETGARLSPTVSDAFERLHSAYDEARSETRSVLTLTSVPIFASNFLARHLGLFQLAHPEIAVRLDTDSRHRDFEREAVDVGIRIGDGKWPGLTAQHIMPVSFAPMLSPSLLARAGRLETPADLLRLPIIDPLDRWWKPWFAGVGLPDLDLSHLPQSDLGTQALAASAALAGQGVAILTPIFFQDALRSGALVQPFEFVGGDGKDFWLIHAESRANIRKIKIFRNWLLEHFPDRNISPD